VSAMREAFGRAGYEDAETWPSESLRDIARKAMIAHADDTSAAQLAIFDACCRPGSLARSLFLPWFRQATAALIAEERRHLKAVQKADNLTDQQRRALAVVNLAEQRAEAEAKAARQRVLEERAHTEQERAAQIDEWLKNKARYEMIDGASWWSVSPARLTQFARRMGHRSRFYTLVLERLPEHDDIRPVSYYLRPSEVDELWDKAWGNEQED
jgi:hypothetical protein